MGLPSQVPIVIGVTGHRDLRPQDMPALEREIGGVITRLRRDYTGEGPDATPLILISALAEGADRVCARVALSMGVKLIAPLPLPADEYRHDFEPGLHPGASADFDELLSLAAAAPAMPFTPGNSLEAVRTDPDKRAEQYRAVGLFIVQHCDVLVALWDGNEKDRAVGGTGEVVTFKRKGIPLVVSGSAHASLDGSEIGPVIHIVTPRMKAGSPATAVAVRPWGAEIATRNRGNVLQGWLAELRQWGNHLVGREQRSIASALPPDQARDLEAWETFDALIALTREFNGEAKAFEARPDGSLQTASGIDDLFVDPENRKLDRAARQRATSVAPHWCQFFGIADALARERQARFRKDWRWLFGFALAAVLVFALSNQIDSLTGRRGYSDWMLVGYAIIIILVFYQLHLARKGRHQERFLDYRALAEALRVTVYWNILGIDGRRPGNHDPAGQEFVIDTGTFGTIADSYPIKQPSELAWIKICLRTIGLWHGTQETTARPEIDPEAHMIARRLWVHGQFDYFQRQGPRHNRIAEALESWGSLAVVVTLFVLIPLMFVASHVLAGPNHMLSKPDLGTKVHDLLVVFIGFLPGIAATLTSYSERLAHTAQARQYDRMRMLFKRAHDLLPHTFDKAAEHRVLSLYRELGIEAMKESADWVAVYRQRPIGPVQ
jgi:hypothetical protein